MTANILEKLFGSSARVKIMKLFLFNDEQNFDKKDVEKRAKVSSADAAKEIKLLCDIRLLNKRQITKTSKTKTGRTSKKKVQAYYLNPNFGLLKELRNLVINNEPLQHADISKRIGKAGKIKLIIISGVFIQNDDSRVDLLVVGDQIKDRSLKNVIATMEADIGKELRYSALSTSNFKYRFSVCDRLVRDILDYNHEVVVDRIGLE
jgi:hypothetical protein